MSEEEKKEKRKKPKITISSLLLALSCLFFILFLMIIMLNPFPYIFHTTDYTHYRLMCSRNLHELCVAIHSYAIDYDYMLPTPSKWCDLLIEHGEVTKDYFKCRVAKSGPCNYAMNRNLENIGLDTKNWHIVLLFETYPGWNQVGDSDILTTANHEGEGCNVLFLDYGIEFVKKQDFHKLKWKPDEAQKE